MRVVQTSANGQSAVTVSMTVSHRLLPTAATVKRSKESTETTMVTNPSSCAILAIWPPEQECHAKTINETILENVAV